MIKRLSASALVVLTLAACQQTAQEEPAKAVEPKAAVVKKEIDYTPRVVNINDVKFMTPEMRDQLLGKNWEKNNAIMRYVNPENVEIKVDMTEDKNVNLKYVKQFALRVSAKNSKGYGSVSISSDWHNEGAKLKFEAISDDKATFLRWEGDVEDAEIDGLEISVTMDKARKIFAVFASNKNTLTVNSEFGKTKGSGSYDRGQTANWSVTSPHNISQTERAIAPVAEGELNLEDDKLIKIDWTREYKASVSTNELGTVNGGNEWLKSDSETSLEAVAADETIAFDHWVGVPADIAKTNPLSLKMSKGYTLKAIFVKKQFNLAINTERGEASGNGLQANGSDAEWSVTSPVAGEEEGTRWVAVPASGTIKMSSNKSVDVKWVKELCVKVVKNNGGELSDLEEIWVVEGQNLKSYQPKLAAETEKLSSWDGVSKDKRHSFPLNVKVTKPFTLTANINGLDHALTFTNPIDNEPDVSKHQHNTLANKKVANIRMTNDDVRHILDTKDLSTQVQDVAIKETEKVKIDDSNNIDKVDYAGWKECVRVRTAYAQLIISPDAGRVVYFGSPDNKTNLLWLNEDYKGTTTSPKEAREDWADKGGSRVWFAPLQSRLAITGQKFPPAYEVDGAPYRRVIISNNKVIIQNFASDAYGCAIERTFELKKNRLIIETSITKTGDVKHGLMLGPVMLTQFIRPDKVTFQSSTAPADHLSGYQALQGAAPEFKKNELDDSRFTYDIEKSYPSDWKFGTQAPFTQLEFKTHFLNSYIVYDKSSAIFPEKNCNVTFFFPETPTDYIEVGNTGELYDIKEGKTKASKVIWELEKR